MSTHTISAALRQSLIQGPLLIGNLPEAYCFPHHTLTIPENPPPLNLHQKLGHLYEDALTSLLEATPQYSLLHQSLQLRRKPGHTLGELDYLLREISTQKLIHLELAVKFYLAVETENALLLPGPDARDNYYRKMEKMRTHQLILPKKFSELLPQEYHSEKITTQQLVYGCIFDHITAPTPANPEFSNPHRRQGRWLRLSELTAHFPQNTQYEIIPKPLWPVPLKLLENIPLEPWTPQPTLDRCTLLRIKNHPLPLFVTPNNYPEM